ncbi:MAG: hypothetical protein R2932_03560 [Caldilineaceae bacterium]
MVTSLWQFAGQVGEIVTISLVDTEDGSFDPYLTLYSADGRSLIQDDDSGDGLDGYDALIQNFMLPQTGIYYVKTGREGSSARHELALSVNAPGQPITFNVPFEVTEPVRYPLHGETAEWSASMNATTDTRQWTPHWDWLRQEANCWRAKALRF